MGIRDSVRNLAVGFTRGSRDGLAGQNYNKSQMTAAAAPTVYMMQNGKVQAVKLWGNNNNFVNYAYGAYAPVPIDSTPVGYAYASIASVWAMRSIEVRSKAISRFDPYIYDRKTKQRVTEHPLAIAIRRSNQRLFRLHEWSQMIWGETFFWPKENDFGYHSDIQWLNNIGMAVDTGFGYIQNFSYTPVQGGVPHIWEPEQIAFFKTDNPFNDLRGLSRFESILIDVGIERDMARSMKAFYTNESRPGLMLLPETDLNPADAKGFMDYWKENLQGPANANKPMLMPKAIKDVVEIQRAPVEDDVDVRTSLRSEVCAAFGVPLALAGAWDDANYDSVDTQRKSFYEETMIPEADDIASDWTQRIIPFFDNSGTLELKFDYTHIMALIEDADTKASIANARLATGGITLNEYRQALNMQAVENGDVYYVPSGIVVTPAAELGAAPIAPDVPATPPTGAPSPASPDAPASPPSGETNPGNPVPEAAVSAGKSAAIMLNMGGNPDLMHLQERVKQYVGDTPTEWNKTDDFHVTLAYAPSVSDEQMTQLKAALAAVELPVMALSVGGLRTFDTLGEYAIHFRIRRNADLLDLQEDVYDICKSIGMQMSSYSDPRTYTPHVTMGYSKQRPPAQTFDGKLTVKPVKLTVDYGDETAYEKAITEPVAPAPAVEAAPVSVKETALDELAAWEKKVKNKGIKSAFQTYLIRDAVADDLRRAIEAAGDDKAVIKAAFDATRSALEIKAIQATRVDFENAFEDVLNEARAGNLTRTRWASITRQLIRTFGARAFRDALTESGIDDDPDESEQDTIAALIQDQSQYVTALGAKLFKDEDSISDDMAAQKPAMWFNGSIQPFYAAGKLSADGNAMHTWVLGGAENHCDDCPKLNGKRARYKTWYRKNLIAGTVGQATQCQGWECDCKLLPAAGKSSADVLSFDDLISGKPQPNPKAEPDHTDRFNFEGYEVLTPDEAEKKYNPSQPREDNGEFGEGGGSSGGGDKKPIKPDKEPAKKPEKKPAKPKPEQPKQEEDNRNYQNFGAYDEGVVADNFQRSAPKPTTSQHDAMEYYRDIQGNADLNGSLRKGEPLSAEGAAHAKELDSLLASSKLEHDTMTYRGIAPSNPQAKIFRDQIASGQLKSGSVLTDKGYASTTLDGGIANSKFAEDGGVVFKIKAPKGSDGLYMNAASDKFVGGRYNGEFRDEKELLLPRNSQYKIGKIEKNGNQYVVEMTYEGVGAGV